MKYSQLKLNNLEKFIEVEAKRFWKFCLENYPSYMGVPNNKIGDGVFIDSSNQILPSFESMVEIERRRRELLNTLKKEQEEEEKQRLMGEEVF